RPEPAPLPPACRGPSVAVRVARLRPPVGARRCPPLHARLLAAEPVPRHEHGDRLPPALDEVAEADPRPAGRALLRRGHPRPQHEPEEHEPRPLEPAPAPRRRGAPRRGRALLPAGPRRVAQRLTGRRTDGEDAPRVAPIVDTVEIAKSPPEVFAYLGDLSRHGEWQEQLVDVEVETEGRTRVGTRAVETR